MHSGPLIAWWRAQKSMDPRLPPQGIRCSPATSLVVQWLSLRAPNAWGLGSIPDWGTRSHVPQLRPVTVTYILKKEKKGQPSLSSLHTREGGVFYKAGCTSIY